MICWHEFRRLAFFWSYFLSFWSRLCLVHRRLIASKCKIASRPTGRLILSLIPTEQTAKEIRETSVDQLKQKRRSKQQNPTRRRIRRDDWLSTSVGMREHMIGYATQTKEGSLSGFFRPRIKRITRIGASKRRTFFGLGRPLVACIGLVIRFMRYTA
jgi:hypothetical protein